MKVFNKAIKNRQKPEMLSYLKVIAGLILLLSLITQNRLDPSPLNLLWPAEGISNWLGLPGAILAGFLTDVFGWCGFLVPMSLLALVHKNGRNRWQITILDSAAILLVTIGLAQLASQADAQLGRMTGLIGVVSNIYLQEFPGKLITILIVVGFFVRYASHYRVNWHFFVMLRQSTVILMLVLMFLDRFAQKRFSRIRKRLGHYFAPLSSASKDRLTAARQGSARNWSAISGIVGNWLLDLNPFCRLPSEKDGGVQTGHLPDDILTELEKRRLLSDTIMELERRVVVENS